MFLLFAACVVPTSGNYLFAVASETTDCPDDYAASGEPVGTWTVTVTDTTVVMSLEPDEVCKRDGVQFTCSFAGTDSTTDYADRGMDAVMTLDMNMNGEWLGTNAIQGEKSVTTSCTGADCTTLADAGAPACATTWSYFGELQEE